MCAFFALVMAVSAQTTSGSIAGNVIYQQQSAIPIASVTIRDDTKGFSQSTVSDHEGPFVFPQLSPGNYRHSIEGKGFKKAERTDLLLVANDKLAPGIIVLEVGNATETVTVTAEATLVQSENARNMQLSARFQF